MQISRARAGAPDQSPKARIVYSTETVGRTRPRPGSYSKTRKRLESGQKKHGPQFDVLSVKYSTSEIGKYPSYSRHGWRTGPDDGKLNGFIVSALREVTSLSYGEIQNTLEKNFVEVDVPVILNAFGRKATAQLLLTIHNAVGKDNLKSRKSAEDLLKVAQQSVADLVPYENPKGAALTIYQRRRRLEKTSSRESKGYQTVVRTETRHVEEISGPRTLLETTHFSAFRFPDWSKILRGSGYDAEELAQPDSGAVEAVETITDVLGPYFTEDAVLELCGIDKYCLAGRVKQNRLVVAHDENGRSLFPIWQFMSDGSVVAGVDITLQKLKRYNTLGLFGAIWLTVPRGPLGWISPVEYLISQGFNTIYGEFIERELEGLSR